MKLVHPAFQSLLGHIRSVTFDKFKEAFDNALESGEGFSVAALDCAQSYSAQFDKKCAGILALITWLFAVNSKKMKMGYVFKLWL